MNLFILFSLIFVYPNSFNCLFVFNNPSCLKIKCLSNKIIIYRYASCPSSSFSQDNNNNYKYLTFKGCRSGGNGAGGCQPEMNCVDTTIEHLSSTNDHKCMPKSDCPLGTISDGINCHDIDECLELPCHSKNACHNLNPGFRCDSCPSGFSGKIVYGIGKQFARNNRQVIISLIRLIVYSYSTSSTIL